MNSAPRLTILEKTGSLRGVRLKKQNKWMEISVISYFAATESLFNEGTGAAFLSNSTVQTFPSA